MKIKTFCNVAILTASLSLSLELRGAASVTYDRGATKNTIRQDSNNKPFDIPAGTLLAGSPLGTSNTIRNGSGVPDPGLGVNGDFYVQTDVTPQVIYGPKTAGLWGSGTSLGGPAGPSGPAGPAGSGNFTSDASSSIDSEVVLFNGTSGGHAKRATGSGLAKLINGVLSLIADGIGWLHNDGAGNYVWSIPSKSDVGLSNVSNNDTTNAANITSGTIGNQRIPLGIVNSQIATYTAVAGDSGKLITMNGSSLTFNLPASPPNSNWNVIVENLNSTSLTVSRNGLSINGGTVNITLPQYGMIQIRTDGTNYFSSVPLIAGSNITLTPSSNSLTISATSGGGLGFAGNLTTQTTINSTTTYTTGGINLTNQTAASGSTWRIRATGQFVRVNSATARNMQIAVFWGSTQLTAITKSVGTGFSSTNVFETEFILNGTSTTAITAAGFFIIPALAGEVALTPTSTIVTSGTQTIDLRFSMSTVVATDQWLINDVTIERLQ